MCGTRILFQISSQYFDCGPYTLCKNHLSPSPAFRKFKIPVLTPPFQNIQKGNENSLFPHRKSIARSWNDSKNLVTGNLGKREVTTRIKCLKMTKPQSRGKAKGGARTAQEHIRSGNTFYLTLPRNDGSLKCFPDNKNNS